MNIKTSIFYSLFIALLAFSCSEDFLEKQPTNALTNQTYWATTSNAGKAVVGCYQFLGDDWWKTFLTCATDDSYAWSNWPCDILYAGNGSATASLGTFSHFWSFYYQAIAACNNVIDNIDNVPNINPDDRNRMVAEVKVIRAYAYQQLVGLYGDVPLITSLPNGPAEYNVERTSAADVMDFISQDLASIADDLPESSEVTEKGRISKGAALALKARIDLYNKNYKDAADAAQQVMKMTDGYIIDPDYESLFNGTNEESKEIILAAQYIETHKNAIATWVGGPFVGGWSEVVPLQSLVNAYECTDGKTIDESVFYDPENPFENRDPRLKMTIVVPGSEVNGSIVDITDPNSPDGLGKNNASYSGYYYKKYIPAVIDGGWDGNSTNDIIVIRYAEVLLTYAEAKIELGEIDQSVLDAINEVRGRESVQLPAVTTTSQDELRTILRRERRVEFAMEEHRLFDIRRWGIAEEVMPGPVYGILNYWNPEDENYGKHKLIEERQFDPEKDYLWAIPQRDMDINKKLTQNPGW
ncbi:RagB/SusD family nutrient uptake outer membrane protein [Thermophagus sp. OGC60D27]|uniref:RagB/SusD family nutrient uptake outer membrane protein n=1 Tax=Thermophagus sp. OGC60D27 TaxID=3458415 RepID=UPI004038356B